MAPIGVLDELPVDVGDEVPDVLDAVPDPPDPELEDLVGTPVPSDCVVLVAAPTSAGKVAPPENVAR